MFDTMYKISYHPLILNVTLTRPGLSDFIDLTKI
jgi:hypothetical protein